MEIYKVVVIKRRIDVVERVFHNKDINVPFTHGGVE